VLTVPERAGTAGSAVGAAAFPSTIDEVMAMTAAWPAALLLAGGTELMAQINAGRLWPAGLILLERIEELRGVWFGDGELVLGASTTCADLTHADVRAVLPALAQAARTIGSPSLRSRATLGGNLVAGRRSGETCVAAEPGRDLLPVLVALGATAVLRSPSGWRQIPIVELYARDGGVDLRTGELLTALRIPLAGGLQGYMKVAVRGGAARTVLTLALAVDLDARTTTCAVGGMAPMAIRLDHPGQWLAEHVDWAAGAIPDPGTYPIFARLVAEGLLAPRSAGPAGSSTAAVPDEYRRRAAEICARRALVRALPPAGWLEQVRQYQQRAEFLRHAAAVERHERGLPELPPVPRPAPPAQRPPRPQTSPDPHTSPSPQTSAASQGFPDHQSPRTLRSPQDVDPGQIPPHQQTRAPR
jgi:CO/xanthine dehydrogenase FAD-binding subunit